MNAKKTNNYPTDAGNYAIDERVSVLFQPDTLVAEEFLGNYRRKTPLEPEKTPQGRQGGGSSLVAAGLVLIARR